MIKAKQESAFKKADEQADQVYAASFFTPKTRDELKHGTGNMGKMGSFPLDEIVQKNED